MKNSFYTAAPNSELLKSCIAYYYFDESQDENTTKSFIYYPHYKNALTIYKNSKIRINHAYSTTTIPSGSDYSFGFSKLISSAAQAELLPPYNRIGVVFQPLGLNHFLQGHLSDHVHFPVNVDFELFKETMVPCLESIFEAPTIQDKVALLDAYFLSEHKGFTDKKMEQAMHLLFEDGAKYSVDLLAEKLKVSRKTLLRMFKKHQNSSVIDYLKMIQFRKSIEIFQNAKDKTTLSELAYDTAYYDQSDFINHFKKLTGFNPKSFFKQLTVLGDKGTFWTLK
jgi:AraC-like DNA-binding protein